MSDVPILTAEGSAALEEAFRALIRLCPPGGIAKVNAAFSITNHGDGRYMLRMTIGAPSARVRLSGPKTGRKQ